LFDLPNPQKHTNYKGIIVPLRHCIAVLLLSACAFATGGLYQDKAMGKLINGNMLLALPGATIEVCTDQACVSPITLYSDAALTVPLGTSTVADVNANFRFFGTPGVYWCQESALGFATATALCQISSATGSGGSGTVTSVSSGNLSPLFTVAVATSTVTPAFSFTLSTAAAHNFFGNNTGSTAAPAYFRPACADLSDASAFCNGTAYSSLTGVPQLPITKTAVTSFWLRSYDSTTGVFTTSQPAFTDISGVHTCAQEPAQTGDVTSSSGSCGATVVALNGTSLAGLATGILKNTTSTGVPSIAAFADLPAINSVSTAHGVALNEGAATPLGGTAVGGANFPLIGVAASDPAWSTIAYPTTITASGCLVYASSTTSLACGANIAANKVIRSAGSGTAPVASNITDGTTVGLVSINSFVQANNTVRLTADSSAITATTPGTAFLTFAANPVSTNFSFKCELLYSQATAVVLDGFAVQGATNAPTRLDAWGSMDTTNPTSTNYTGSKGSALNITTTTATPVVSATPGATGTVYQATLKGTIQGGASAPTLTIYAFTGNASDAVTIKAGSYCSEN
jgi:hypothetical protein